MTGSVQQQADAMLNANYDCVIDNDQPACVFAQNAYAQLDHIYVQTMQAANLQGYGSQQFHDQLAAHTGGYVDPRSHQTNMRQIQAWGASRIDWGNQQGAGADSNHQAFIDHIRQQGKSGPVAIGVPWSRKATGRPGRLSSSLFRSTAVLLFARLPQQPQRQKIVQTDAS